MNKVYRALMIMAMTTIVGVSCVGCGRNEVEAKSSYEAFQVKKSQVEVEEANSIQLEDDSVADEMADLKHEIVRGVCAAARINQQIVEKNPKLQTKKPKENVDDVNFKVAAAEVDFDEEDFEAEEFEESQSTTNVTREAHYDRAMAQQIWALVNAERTASGLNALAWDETAYNFACGRAIDIMSDFSHNGCKPYGENILFTSYPNADAAELHDMWYNSPGHHTNYMRENYSSGACAVYYCDGAYYAVENFMAVPTVTWIENDYSDNTFDTDDTDYPTDEYVIPNNSDYESAPIAEYDTETTDINDDAASRDREVIYTDDTHTSVFAIIEYNNSENLDD